MSTRLRNVFVLLAALVVACSEGPARTLVDVPLVDDVSGPPPTCSLPEVRCSNRCVDPASDLQNCGGCGVACARGQVCAGGRCDVMCPEGQARCGDRCATIQTDRANCGACGHACPAGQVCTQGRCDVVCGPMYMSCEAPSADAGVADAGAVSGRYCTTPMTDELNCGACGRVCPPGNVCMGGECALSCGRGFAQCGGTCVDVQTSTAHCGMCGRACAGAQRCVAGVCEGAPCAAGQTLCDGACVNLRASAEHCGACGNRCAAPAVCDAASCVTTCLRGFTACMGACVDLQSDARHCGTCGSACPTGQSCVRGACALVCPLDRVACGGACVDLSSDTAHCGACGRACAAGARCAAGVCGQSCGADQTLCPDGRCASLAFDPANCGACGLRCAASSACVMGRCLPVADAGGAVVCPSPGVLCGASCVDTAVDNLHCGGCGRACAATEVCVGGACVAPCLPGYLRCGGVCVPGLNSSTNCGVCGRACATGQACVVGRCVMGAAPTRFTATLSAGVAYVDACALPGATRVFAATDEAEYVTRMPFAFRYFTADIAESAPVVVSTNGWVALDGMLYGGRSPSSPSTLAPNLMLAVHAGDQETVDPICLALTGVAPSRRWIVQWSGSAERTSVGPVAGTRVSYEVLVYEQTGVIEFVYGSITGSATSRYHGIEGPSGLTPGSVSACPSGTTSHLCTVSTGYSARFTPAS